MKLLRLALTLWGVVWLVDLKVPFWPTCFPIFLIALGVFGIRARPKPPAPRPYSDEGGF